MQPATSEKENAAAPGKGAAFDASLDKKASKAADGGGDDSGPAKKAAGPLAKGPQAKGDKGKVGKAGANKFGKSLAKVAGGKAGVKAAGGAAKGKAAAKGGGGDGGGPAPAPAGGGGPEKSAKPKTAAKGGPKAPKPKKKKKSGGGGGKKSGAAAAAAGGGGGGGGGGASKGGTRDVAKDLVKAPMTKFAKNIGKAGSNLTKSLNKETKDTHKALPEFKAVMPGEAQGGDAKKLAKANPDKTVGDGKVGPEPKKKKLKKEKAVKAKKSKAGGKTFGKLKKDTSEDILKKLFGRTTSKITSKSGQNTDPGVEPPVVFKGTSDPERAGRQNTGAQDKITAAQEKADTKIAKIDETTLVQRKELDKTLTAKQFVPPKLTEVPADLKMVHFSAKADQHGTAVADAADKDMQAEFEGHLGKADGQFQGALDKQEEGKAKAIADTEKTIDDSNKKAMEDQEKAVKDNRKAIDDKKKETRKAQDKEVKKAKRKGDAERKKTEKKIGKRQKSDDKKIATKYKAAEKKAKGKKKTAEAKAAKEKKKAEKKKKKKSFWGSICSAIGSFLDKCCALIGDIFDALSKVVGDILNAVKDAAMAIVDAAVAFACKALDVLGDMLKKMVSGLLGGIFPGLAKALNDLIDKAVNVAKTAVKKVGEFVKKAVAAAIDGLNKVVQKVLSVAKVAIQTALTVASAVVTGDWEKALRALLEGALDMAGIGKESFYAFVGKSMDTIKKIVDNPGAFIGNLISAVGQGFGLFSDNFLKHLANGLVGWLTGTLSDVGLKMPNNFDISGIFDVVLQIMGLSKDKLLGKVEKKIGKDNMDLLKTVWGYAEAAIKGGLAGLWEHAKDHLSDLWDTVIGGIQSWLVEKLVTQAVLKIASMFNPVGAIVQVLLTAWNVYKFVKEQAAKIFALVNSVVDSLADIVAGNLGPAAKKVEGALAKLVPIVISFLANLLGLGGVADKVKEIIGKIQATVDKAVDKVIDKFWELGKKAFATVKGALSGDKKDEKTADAKPEEKKKEERDPAKLPKVTLATKSGALDLGWDAKKGGNTAVTKISGPKFAGKVGAKAVPSMASEADKLQGEAKASASKHIGTAKMQVVAADSKAGGWIRGEHDDLAGVKTSHDLLARALFEAADVLGAANSNATEDDVAMPKPTKFTSADGHTHTVWAEAKDGKAQVMVASTPIRIQDQLAAWRPLLKGLPEASRKTVGKEIGKGISLEKKADVEADLIAAGKGNPAKLSALQADLAVSLKAIFSITETAKDGDGDQVFAGIDPRDTLVEDNYKKFQKRFKDLGKKLGLSGSGAEAERIWLETVMTIQRTDQKFQDLTATEPGHYKRKLSSEGSKRITREFDPIIAALEPYMKKWVETQATDKWAFWSGKAALNAAKGSGWNSLEGSAMGGLFDGLNINGSWNIQLWTALSESYAKSAATAVGKAQFGGFLGLGCQGIENIYKQVEKKAFVKMLKAEKKAMPSFIWYAVRTDPEEMSKDDPDLEKPDPKANLDGITGVFFKSTKRSVAVARAEEENRKLVPWGDAPAENLYAHLESHGEVAAGIESGLKGALKKGQPPTNPKLKMPDVEKDVVHHRPSLKKLFDTTSTVGQSLIASVRDLSVEVNVQGFKRRRDARIDSPYFKDLQKAVGSGLSSSVRLPTIRDQVLRTGKPSVPASARTKIEAWLKAQPAQDADLPSLGFKDRDGNAAEIAIRTSGDKVLVELVKPEKVEIKKKVPGTTAMALAAEIETASATYLSSVESDPATAEKARKIIVQKLAELKDSMADARNENSDLVQLRAKFESKFGAEAAKESSATENVDFLVKKAVGLMAAHAGKTVPMAKKVDQALFKKEGLDDLPGFTDFVAECGIPLSWGFAGAVGKNYEKVQEVLAGGNLRQKVMHLVQFGEVWAKKVFDKDEDEMREIMSMTGAHAKEIEQLLGAMQRAREKGKLDKKGLFSGGGNTEYDLAKAGPAMDRKLPKVAVAPGTLTIEQLKALVQMAIPKKAASVPTRGEGQDDIAYEAALIKFLHANGVKSTGGGHAGSAVALSEKQRTDETANISGDESALELNAGRLPWLEGMRMNIVDEDNWWIKLAHTLEMPLKAGISGTTSRFMHFNNLLGGKPHDGRMTMIAYLIPIEAHSVHEIATAAQGFCPYEKGKYLPFKPLANSRIRSIASSAGVPPEKIDEVLGVGKKA